MGTGVPFNEDVEARIQTERERALNSYIEAVRDGRILGIGGNSENYQPRKYTPK